MSKDLVKSESVTASEAGNKREAGVYGGKLKTIVDTVTLDYDMVAGDLITMEKLPGNCIVLDGFVKGPTKTTGIFELGLFNAAGSAIDATNTFVKGCDLDGTNGANFKRVDALSTGINARISNESALCLKCTESMTATEGNGTKVEVVIQYVVD